MYLGILTLPSPAEVVLYHQIPIKINTQRTVIPPNKAFWYGANVQGVLFEKTRFA